MLNVLDEKWKDHLYDLDQLRNAIHYRSWGQKDPLIEYKQEAYTMFVDLMNDIYNTFTERFLKVQLVFEPPPDADGRGAPLARPRGDGADEALQRARHPRGRSRTTPRRERRRASATAAAPARRGHGHARTTAEDGRSSRDRIRWSSARARTRSLSGSTRRRTSTGRTSGRNDPCPCGSGKKFKKCHGATL